MIGRHTASALARYALSLAALAFVFWAWIDSGEFLASLRGCAPGWLAVAACCTFCGRWLQALQSHFLLRDLGLASTPRLLLGTQSLSASLSFVAPSELIAGAVGWKVLSRRLGGSDRIAFSMLYVRALFLWSALTFGACGLLYEFTRGRAGGIWVVPSVLLLSSGITLLLIRNRAAAGHVERLVVRLEALPVEPVRVPKWLTALGRWLGGLLRPAAAERQRPVRTTAGRLALTLMIQASYIAQNFFVGLSVALAVPWSAHVWGFGVALLAQMIPVTIGGWGTREISLIALFAFLYQVPEAQTMSYSLLITLLSLLSALVLTPLAWAGDGPPKLQRRH